jgi:ubiquinone/menaquinone biosynthesis C-methylase UbiE
MSNPAIFPTAMPDLDWWHALWPDPGVLIVSIDGIAGSRVVDLCCGDGWFTLPLAQLAREVIAIDLDAHMLQLTGQRLAVAGVSNSELIEGDAYDIAKLVTEPADVVLIANTFHGVTDKTRLAREVARVLVKGGRFVVVNWHRRPREDTTVLGKPRGPATDMRMETADIVATVEPSGFSLTQVVELPPYHYVAEFKKKAEAVQLPDCRSDEKPTSDQAKGGQV